MSRAFILTALFALALAASSGACAQDSAPMAAPPAATSDLPFVNSGANQPVLQPLSPDGVPVDPAHALMHEGMPGEHPEQAAHAKKSGLPQFDTSTFARQLFWLLLVFSCLYVVFARKTLPLIGSVLKKRHDIISSDIDTAEGLKGQVEQTRNAYEAAIAAAQADAQKQMADIIADGKKTAELRDAEFKSRTEQATQQLEMQLSASRSRILGELTLTAADLAADIATRIGGVKVDTSSARAIIDAETGKAKAA